MAGSSDSEIFLETYGSTSSTLVLKTRTSDVKPGMGSKGSTCVP